MADVFYNKEVAGYITNGIIRVVYKTTTTSGTDNGQEYQYSVDHTNDVDVFTCEACFATVLGDNTDAHTAWHNPGAS